MATEKQIMERYGATHHIQKARMVGEIELDRLTPKESVAMGDGETYYWLLTEKSVAKNNLVQADVSGRSELLLSFFLWFRANGELYVDKPIEEMIKIYEKESNSS